MCTQSRVEASCRDHTLESYRYSVAVAKDDFNAQPSGLCYMAGYPIGCNIAPEVYGECSRGKDAGLDALIIVNGPIIVCFAGILFFLGSLTHHVYIL